MHREKENYPLFDIYSYWHRYPSTSRYINDCRVFWMSDIDCGAFIEWGDGKIPLMATEAARDSGQEKNVSFLVNWSKMINGKLPPVPVFVVYYSLSTDHLLPTGENGPSMPDIETFRVKRLYPEPWPSYRFYEPNEWANEIAKIKATQIDLLRNLGPLSQFPWK
jgi:hypothetical protein